jgi:hypothetical protein
MITDMKHRLSLDTAAITTKQKKEEKGI